jgi:hypothetical protein
MWPHRKAADDLPPHPTSHHVSFAQSRLVARLTILVLLAVGRSSFAVEPPPLNEFQLKTGYLFNFTRFVEWPEGAFLSTKTPLLVCIVGDTPMTNLLIETAVGKVVNGRSVEIKRIRAMEDLRECHLVFVSLAEQRRVVRILDSLRGTNALTVGEDSGFVRAGGMINFYIQDNKVKLEINLEAASRAHLKISAKLIAVARVVSHTADGGGI